MTDRPSPPARACPSCAGREFRLRYHPVEGGRSIWRCVGCGVWVLQPFPAPAELKRLYEEDYAERWAAGQPEEEGVATIKQQVYAGVLQQVERHTRPRRILDVGCGMGFSLGVARDRGYEAHGLEVSGTTGGIARARYGEAVTIGDIQQATLAAESFDVVTMVDLLEHVEDPVGVLRRAWAALAPGGILALTVPDTASVSARLLGRHWPHITTEHLYHYRRSNLAPLLARCGFAVEAARPAVKPVSLAYAGKILGHTKNAGLHRWLVAGADRLPAAWRAQVVRVPSGQLLVIARKVGHGQPA